MEHEQRSAYRPVEGERVRGAFVGIGRVTAVGHYEAIVDTPSVKAYRANVSTLRPAWSGVAATLREVYMAFVGDLDDDSVDRIAGRIFEAVGDYVEGASDELADHGPDLAQLATILTLAAARYDAGATARPAAAL